MTELGSPLKLEPSTSKRRKLSLILEKCVICQKSGRETVVSFTDPEKESLDIVYHKSCCYKSYTSEHNIVVFTSRQTDEVAAGPSKDSKGLSMLTRSKSSAINWSVCIFCNKKSYKQDKRLLKIESDERVTRISTAANYYGDSTMLFSSPGPKVQVNYCHHMASVVCKLFIFQASSPKPLGQLEPNLAGMILGWSFTKFLFFVPVGYSTCLPGPIICSDWLKFQRSSLKIMN